MKKKALMISCFDWYKSRLEPIRQLLLEEYETMVLIADFDHINKKHITDKNPECTYIHVPEYHKNLSLERIRSHMNFGKAVEYYLERFKPSLIYLQMPPNNMARYCLRYKKKHPQCTYIVDIIDLWPESMPLKGLEYTPPVLLWKKWRDDSIQVADYVFLECSLYKRKLRHVLNTDRTSTLYLFKDLTDEVRRQAEELRIRKRVERPVRQAEGLLRLGYVGSISHIIDIHRISQVIKEIQTDGTHVQLQVIGDGESREELLKALRSAGAEVIWHGKVFDQKEKTEILGRCDYGLNMMVDGVSVGLTIKSMDYISIGLPMINNIRGDTWKFVEHCNVGINVESDGIKIPRGKMLLKQADIAAKNTAVLYEHCFTRQAFEKKVQKEFPHV